MGLSNSGSVGGAGGGGGAGKVSTSGLETPLGSSGTILELTKLLTTGKHLDGVEIEAYRPGGDGPQLVDQFYFEQVFVPLMAPAVLLMGAAPLARWRHGSLPDMAQRLRWAGIASVAIGVGLLLVLRNASAMTGLGLLLAAWCVLSAVASLAARLRHQRGHRLSALRQLTRRYGTLLSIEHRPRRRGSIFRQRIIRPVPSA